MRITPSGHPMPTPDRRHVPKTIIWGVISPPVSFHVSVKIRSVPAVVAQLVGRVGFDFLMSNFPGFEPRVGVLFPESGFGGSGFTSGFWGGPRFHLGFLGVSFLVSVKSGLARAVVAQLVGCRVCGWNGRGSIPGRDPFFSTHTSGA